MTASEGTTRATSGRHLASACDTPVAFHYAATRRLAAWWAETRADAELPLKNALEPLAIPDLLPFLWINEHDAANGCFVYRLVGEEIRGRYATPLKDRNLADIFPVATARRIQATMERVAFAPCAYHHLGAIYESCDRVGFGERLLLPLGPGAGPGTHVLGISIYDVGTCAPAKQPRADGGDRGGDIRRFYPLSAIENLAFPDGRQAPPRDPMAE